MSKFRAMLLHLTGAERGREQRLNIELKARVTLSLPDTLFLVIKFIAREYIIEEHWCCVQSAGLTITRVYRRVY